MADIKLFSWNVNGLRAVLRKGALQQFLKDQAPDILCLQEIKCKPNQLTPLELAELEKDYKIFWNPAERPGYSGTMVLVKTALCSGICPIPQELKVAQGEGRILALDFGAFFLVNVYTPNSKPDLSRLDLRHNDWDPAFKNLLKDLEKDKPVITCGDFNAAHKEIDLARPETNHRNAGFTDEERKGITNLLNAGFLDTFRETHPLEKRYTWWSHWGKARENNVGWRIDYFFISNSLRKNLKDAEIYESVTGSDHCPISITLNLEKK